MLLDIGQIDGVTFRQSGSAAEGASGKSRLRKRKRARAGVEAPRALSRLNDNLMGPLPGATYMSAMQAMHKPISITPME